MTDEPPKRSIFKDLPTAASIGLMVSIGVMFSVHQLGRGAAYASFIGNVALAIVLFCLATPIAWWMEVKRHRDARNSPKSLNLD